MGILVSKSSHESSFWTSEARVNPSIHLHCVTHPTPTLRRTASAGWSKPTPTTRAAGWASTSP